MHLLIVFIFLFGAVFAVFGFVKGIRLFTQDPEAFYATEEENDFVSKATEKKTFSDEISLAKISPRDHIRGRRDAAIILVEFVDLECPFCKSFHGTLQRVMEQYSREEVAWVYRHFPIDSIHPKAVKEAVAAECVAMLKDEKAFWDYIDAIFEITPSNNGFDVSTLPQMAEQLGVDRVKFEQCLVSGQFDGKVKNEVIQALAAGATSTPYTVVMVGDERIPLIGEQSFEEMKTLLDSLLEK